MNTPCRLVLLALSSLLVSTVQAQLAQSASPVVQFVLVGREAAYQQTGPTTLVPDSMEPFVFKVGVEGQNMTSSLPISAATFTGPNNGSMALGFNAQENRWAFSDTEISSMSSLNAAYPVGAYNITLTGTPNGTATINVPDYSATQLQVPQVTLSGGSWVSGIYMLSDMNALTVTFNSVYSGTVSSTQAFHFDASLGGMQNNNFETSGFINFDPTGGSTPQMSATPPVWNIGTLTAGMYSLHISYDDVQNAGQIYSGAAFGASLLTYRTNVALMVVPEPATVVSFGLGVVLLGFIGWRRTRRA